MRWSFQQGQEECWLVRGRRMSLARIVASSVARIVASSGLVPAVAAVLLGAAVGTLRLGQIGSAKTTTKPTNCPFIAASPFIDGLKGHW